MVYFDFDFPVDTDQVNFTQLNDNWTDLATKINYWNQSPSAIIAPPVGTEAFDPQHVGSEDRIAVYDGTNWNLSLNHETSWNSWVDLTLRAPVVERPGWTPRIRINQWKREIQLSGGILYGAAAPAWPLTDVEITLDTSISDTLAPAPGGLSFQQIASSQITAASGFASAVARVIKLVGPNKTSIFVRWQGDAGGGNFIMLDGLKWWY